MERARRMRNGTIDVRTAAPSAAFGGGERCHEMAREEDAH